jgi:hypothetical protein
MFVSGSLLFIIPPVGVSFSSDRLYSIGSRTGLQLVISFAAIYFLLQPSFQHKLQYLLYCACLILGTVRGAVLVSNLDAGHAFSLQHYFRLNLHNPLQ